MNFQPEQQPYHQGPIQPTGSVPPQGPYGHPVPPQPPKKSNALKIILIVLAAIVVACGAGGALSGKGEKTARPTTPATVASGTPDTSSGGAPVKPPAPGLNTPVRDGKFEFVITEIQSGVKELGDNQFLRKTAQGAYTIVSITVRNISNVPYGFSPGNQYVFDTKNRKFGNDAAAAINLQADTSLYADINPGNSITAQVVFDLPADSEPDHIVLHDSMFSGGTTVSLR
ncbi:DUF4352 domain-containing protein [Nocardia sp. JMUB6875]|uniref:DUF4352 domain-containing protein n=1 Tax=Nocardia sp. JMUB6875 TaxID=3158170 RepID=UPI0032E59465